jgi:hypothetical protein
LLANDRMRVRSWLHWGKWLLLAAILFAPMERAWAASQTERQATRAQLAKEIARYTKHFDRIQKLAANSKKLVLRQNTMSLRSIKGGTYAHTQGWLYSGSHQLEYFVEHGLSSPLAGSGLATRPTGDHLAEYIESKHTPGSNGLVGDTSYDQYVLKRYFETKEGALQDWRQRVLSKNVPGGRLVWMKAGLSPWGEKLAKAVSAATEAQTALDAGRFTKAASLLERMKYWHASMNDERNTLKRQRARAQNKYW